MSQADLARKAGISQPTIAAIESGDQKTARALPRIARALDVDISVLDPEFCLENALSPDNAVVAYQVMLEYLRRDLSQEDRESLSRVFLDLALESLDDKVGGSLADQLRLRVKYLVRPYLLEE
jgi:transcriptional regulator with XRE-family HTH domain